MHRIIIPAQAQKNISKLVKQKKRKIRRIIVLLVVLIAAYIFGFGDYGYYQYYLLKSEEKELVKALDELQAEAESLAKEIDLLSKKDLEYLEKVAREEHGLVKPGEKIYQLTPNKNR
ncbi:septum formation initiator family protein [candidate division KSB1 bacterium]